MIKQPIIDINCRGNANDVSYNNVTTTLSGASLTSNQLGQSNMAYEFDGVNDYIEIGDATTYDYLVDLLNASGLSVYFEIYNKAVSNQNDILFTMTDSGGSGAQGYGLAEFVGSLTKQVIAAGSNLILDSVYSNTTPALNVWKSKSWNLKVDTTNYIGSIYKDGSPLSMADTTTSNKMTKSVNSTRRVRFGWRTDNPANRSFKGTLQNLKIFKHDLSDLENQILARDLGRFK